MAMVFQWHKQAVISDVDTKKQKEKPPLPFSLSTLQIATSKLFNMDADKTLAVPQGQSLFDALPEAATLPNRTADWERAMGLIEKGELQLDGFLKDIYTEVTQQVEHGKKAGGIEIKGSAGSHTCPGCKAGKLKRRTTKKDSNAFWGCDRYLDCKQTVPDKAGKPDFKAIETQDCPECKNPMKRVKGQYGYFWPCRSCNINFKDKRGRPDFTPKIEVAVTDHNCGECGKRLVRRVSKKGRAKNSEKFLGTVVLVIRTANKLTLKKMECPNTELRRKSHVNFDQKNW